MAAGDEECKAAGEQLNSGGAAVQGNVCVGGGGIWCAQQQQLAALLPQQRSLHCRLLLQYHQA
jgi:hypothetical protein